MSEITKSDIEKKSDAEQLASFMKKRNAERAQQKAFGVLASNSDQALQQGKVIEKEPKKDLKKDKEVDKEVDEAEEMTAEEKELEEAKKASLNKAAEHDQTEMYKKLFKEAFLKCFLILAILATLACAVIKLGPAIVSFFNGAISRALMGALGQ